MVIRLKIVDWAQMIHANRQCLETNQPVWLLHLCLLSHDVRRSMNSTFRSFEATMPIPLPGILLASIP